MDAQGQAFLLFPVARQDDVQMGREARFIHAILGAQADVCTPLQIIDLVGKLVMERLWAETALQEWFSKPTEGMQCKQGMPKRYHSMVKGGAHLVLKYRDTFCFHSPKSMQKAIGFLLLSRFRQKFPGCTSGCSTASESHLEPSDLTVQMI